MERKRNEGVERGKSARMKEIVERREGRKGYMGMRFVYVNKLLGDNMVELE